MSFFHIDIIGVPDLILDESASSSWGLLTFREELLSTDASLNSAERIQTTTKIIVEHILQIVKINIDFFCFRNLYFSGFQKLIGGIIFGSENLYHRFLLTK
jgi:hypothetical protein